MKGKKKIIIIVIVLIAAVAVGGFVLKQNKKKNVEVTVAPAKIGSLTKSIDTTGYIQANQKQTVTLSTTQKVDKVYVTEGQKVKKGQLLVKLDDSDLQYQLQKDALNIKVTENNGDTTIRQNDISIDQAKISLQNAVNALNEAKRKYDADSALLTSGYISKDDFEATKKNYMDAQNGVKTAQSQISNLTSSDHQKDKALQIGLIKSDMQNLQQKIKDSKVTANFSGVVMGINAKSNEYPTTDNNTFSISDLSCYKMSIQLNQYDAVSVKLGQPVTIKVNGIDKKYNGYVSKVEAGADIVPNGTQKESKVSIEITIKKADSDFKVGYEADASIMTARKDNVVSVSFDTIKQDANGKNYVFVYRNGKAVKAYLKTGMETDFDVEVIDGIKAGDKIITSPTDSLKDGQPVTVAGGK